MSGTPHHIRRHTLDLHVRGGDADGPRLRAAAAEWQRQVWMPMLERVLDEVDTGDETIAIDRLEVELDDITPGEWNSGAEALAMDKLREAVRKKLRGADVRGGAAARRPLEAIAHYLRTGGLPWWAPKAVAADPGAWLRAWVDGANANTLACEVPTLMHCTAARTRLAAELSEPLFWKLVTALAGPRDPSFWEAEYNRCTATLQKAGAPCEAFCVACRAAILAAVLRMPDEARQTQDFVLELAPVLDAQARVVLARHLEELRQHAALASKPSPDNLQRPAPVVELLSADSLLLHDWDAQDAIRDDEALHTHYITGAGGVLLAPFLPAFFERLGIAEDGVLKDAARATVLIHHLVSGEEKYVEWNLLLPKILCGLLPATLVPTGTIVLQQDERREAAALLVAVIEHWSVLRNTSPDGLRQSFLQREGRLTEKEGAWRLLVQPAAHDVLLQHLPWSISIIKLPWMKAPVYVDWE